MSVGKELNNELNVFASCARLMKTFPNPKGDDWAKISYGLDKYHAYFSKMGLGEFFIDVANATLNEIDRRNRREK